MEDSKLIRGKNLLKNLFLKTYRLNNSNDSHKKTHNGFIIDNEAKEKRIPRSVTIGDMIPSRNNSLSSKQTETSESTLHNLNDDTDSTMTLRSSSTTMNDLIQRRYSSYTEPTDPYEGFYGLPITMASFGYQPGVNQPQDSPVISVDKGSDSEYVRRFPTLEAPIASSELSELTSLSSEAQVYEMNSSRWMHNKMDSVIRRKGPQRHGGAGEVEPARIIPAIVDNRKRLTQSMHVTSHEKADQLYNLATKLGKSNEAGCQTGSPRTLSSLTISNSHSFNNSITTSKPVSNDEVTRIELNVGDRKKIAVFNTRNLKLTLTSLRELFEKAFNLPKEVSGNENTSCLEIYNKHRDVYSPLDSVSQLTDCCVLRLSQNNSEIKAKMPKDNHHSQSIHHFNQKSNLLMTNNGGDSSLRSRESGINNNNNNTHYFIMAKSPPPMTGHSATIRSPLDATKKTILTEGQNCTCPIDHGMNNSSNEAGTMKKVPFQQGQVIYAYPGQLVQIGNNIFQIPHKNNSPQQNANGKDSLTSSTVTPLCVYSNEVDHGNVNGFLSLEPVESQNQTSTLSNSSLDSAYSTRSNTSSETNRHKSSQPSLNQRLFVYQQEMKKLKFEITSLRTLHQDFVGHLQTDADQIRETMGKLNSGLKNLPSGKYQMRLANMSTSIRQHVSMAKRNRSVTAEWLTDLEVVINSLREDALSRWYRISHDEVEAFERQLALLMEKLDGQKKNIPQLKDVWEDLNKLENNERIAISEYLATDESRVDQDLQKCRKMTSTLFTIKRLANVNRKKVNVSLSKVIHTRKDPGEEDRRRLFETIKAIHPNHSTRLISINKYQDVYDRKKKILSHQIVLGEVDSSIESLRKNLDDHVITEAFATTKPAANQQINNNYNNGKEFTQMDFEITDDDDDDDDDSVNGRKSDADDYTYDADDQFCLINETNCSNSEEVSTLERTHPPNTILKNSSNSHSQRQHTRERLVFSKHVLIEDGREVTEINCPMSDVDDQVSLHDGNDSGIGFCSSSGNNPITKTSFNHNASSNMSNNNNNNPWRPLNGFHPGNKVVDIFPKIRTYPKVQGDHQPGSSTKQRSIVL